MLPFAAREKINKCTSYLLSHTDDNGTTYLPHALGTSRQNATHLKQAASSSSSSSSSIRFDREQNIDVPALKIVMRKDSSTHVSDRREKQAKHLVARPFWEKQKNVCKRTFVYLVWHGTIISATCRATILYLSLLALAPIGVCNSLFEPLFFSPFLWRSYPLCSSNRSVRENADYSLLLINCTLQKTLSAPRIYLRKTPSVSSSLNVTQMHTCHYWAEIDFLAGGRARSFPFFAFSNILFLIKHWATTTRMPV